jgi:hypothetical protein
VETLGEQERDLTEGIAREASEQFRIDARDFLSARERGRTTGTRIDQQTAALSDAAEIVSRGFPTLEPSGRSINAISPVVIPNRQSLFWRRMPIGMMVIFLFVGAGDARDSKLRRRRGGAGALRAAPLAASGSAGLLLLVAAERGDGPRRLQGRRHPVREAGGGRRGWTEAAIQPVEAGQLHRQHNEGLPLQRPHKGPP